MTQYNTVNLKLYNSQLNKLKSGMKNGTEESSIKCDCNDETDFQHKLL